MPALLGKNQKQLTTMEANESRLVTKLRYVVEVTNCFCKRSFQALREVQNQSLKHTIEDYKIAGALINKFNKRLISDGDCEEVADKMLETLNQPNELKQKINK
jgi:hypothetical protein